MSYDKILVPVAPGHGDETIKALEVARSLLSPDGRVSAVTVLEDLPRYMASEAYVVEPVFEESQQAAVDQVVQELSDLGVDVVVKHGYPARAIVDLAKDEGHDCIVVASSQPDWRHLLLGSTAAGVVRHAHCSVHVLREQGAADA